MILPKKISPCPIVDALFELRFSSKINSSAVFGLIYNVLQEDYERVENLPILQLPEIVRSSDPNFKYKPYYRISNNDFVIQIGPDVVSISSFPKYVGWTLFSKTIFEVLHKVEKIGIINELERVGIRYINFFENNIFDKINLKVFVGGDEIPYKNTVLRTEIDQFEFKSTLQIANNVLNNDRLGSIIDVDTFMFSDLKSFFDEKTNVLSKGHDKEKELFFSLLQNEFLLTLNPEY
jgi:uncharacterized protein (TIGR04255 family)